MPRSTPVDAASVGAGWVESPRFRCLGFRFSVRSNDSQLVDHVTALYGACLASGPASSRFILRQRTHTKSASVNVYCDGSAVLRNASPALAVAHMVWEVNRKVVERPGSRLLLHAAAAERDGAVVLLPGPQRAGKSTLVAALVQAGLRYVTDETVAVDRTTGTIEPYPKPIALDHDSPALPPGSCPPLDPALEDGLDYRLVPPRRFGRDAVAPLGGVAVVLAFPNYHPDAVTTAIPIGRAEAVVALTEHAFNFRALGPGALTLVADLVRRCRCYRLEVGDLDAARRVVVDLMDDTGAPR